MSTVSLGLEDREFDLGVVVVLLWTVEEILDILVSSGIFYILAVQGVE